MWVAATVRHYHGSTLLTTCMGGVRIDCEEMVFKETERRERPDILTYMRSGGAQKQIF